MTESAIPQNDPTTVPPPPWPTNPPPVNAISKVVNDVLASGNTDVHQAALETIQGLINDWAASYGDDPAEPTGDENA